MNPSGIPIDDPGSGVGIPTTKTGDAVITTMAEVETMMKESNPDPGGLCSYKRAQVVQAYVSALTGWKFATLCFMVMKAGEIQVLDPATIQGFDPNFQLWWSIQPTGTPELEDTHINPHYVMHTLERPGWQFATLTQEVLKEWNVALGVPAYPPGLVTANNRWLSELWVECEEWYDPLD